MSKEAPKPQGLCLKSVQLVYNVDIENRDITGAITYQFLNKTTSPLYFNAKHLSVIAISIDSQPIDPRDVEVITTPGLKDLPHSTFVDVSSSTFAEHVFSNTVGNLVVRSLFEAEQSLTIQFKLDKTNSAITWNSEYMYSSPCSFGEGYLAPRLPVNAFLNELTIFIDHPEGYTSVACGSRTSSTPETDVFISSSPIHLDSIFFAVGKFVSYNIAVQSDGRRAAQMIAMPNFKSYPASINDDDTVAAQEQQVEIISGFVPAKLANAAALQYTLSEVPKMLEFFKADVRIPYPQISFLFVPLSHASTFALKTHTAPGIVLSPIENLITPREPYLVLGSRLFLASGLAMQISHAMFQAERCFCTLSDGLAGLFTFKYMQRVFGRNEAILLYMGLSEFVYEMDNVTQEPLSLSNFAAAITNTSSKVSCPPSIQRLANTEYAYPLGEDFKSSLFRYAKSSLFNIHIFLRSPTSITQKMNTYLNGSLFTPLDPDLYHKTITDTSLSLKHIAGLFKLWFGTNGLPRMRVGYYPNSNVNNATNKKVTIALLPVYRPVRNTWESINVSVQENDDGQPKTETLDISDLHSSIPSCEVGRTARTGKAYNEPLFFLSNARAEIAQHNSSIMYVLVDPEVRFPPAMTIIDQRAACSALQLDRCVSDALQQMKAIRSLAFKVCAASHENLGATLGRNFNYRVCAEAACALAVLSPYSEEKTFNWLETWLKERFYKENKFNFDGADLRKLHLLISLISSIASCRSNTAFTPHDAIETIRKLIMMDFEDFCINPSYIIAGTIAACANLRVPGAPFTMAAVNHSSITKITDRILKRLKDDKLSGSIHSVICFSAIEAVASLSDHGLLDYQFKELSNILFTDSHVVKLRRRILELLTRNIFLCSTLDPSRGPLLDVSKEADVMREAANRLYTDVFECATQLGYYATFNDSIHPAIAVRTLWVELLTHIAQIKPDLAACALQCIELMIQPNTVVFARPLSNKLLHFLWVNKPLHTHRLNGTAVSDLDAALLVRDWPQIFIEQRGALPEPAVEASLTREPRGTCAVCLLGGSCSCSLVKQATSPHIDGIGYQKLFLESLTHEFTGEIWKRVITLMSASKDPYVSKAGVSCLSALSSQKGYNVARNLQIESRLDKLLDDSVTKNSKIKSESEYAHAIQDTINDLNLSLSSILNLDPVVYSGNQDLPPGPPPAKQKPDSDSEIEIEPVEVPVEEANDEDLYVKEESTTRPLNVQFMLESEMVSVTWDIPT